MPTRQPANPGLLQAETQRSSSAWGGISFGLLLVVLVALAAMHLPPLIVLPVTSVLLVSGGFAMAAVAYLRRWRVAPRYEVAGALVFVGFAAALIPDAGPALALLEQMGTQGVAALAR